MKGEKHLRAAARLIEIGDEAVVGSVKSLTEELVVAVRRLIHTFSTEGGRIKNDATARRVLRDLDDLVMRIIEGRGQGDSRFANEVDRFLLNFDELEAINLAGHQTINGIRIAKSRLNAHKRYAVDSVLYNLRGAGMRLGFVDPLRQLLGRAVVTGMHVNELEVQLSEQIPEILRRHVGQVARDALGQYDGMIQEYVRRAYSMDGFIYVNSIVENSRRQCRRWVEMEIIPFDQLAEEIAWAEAYGGGMIPGTTPDNFAINRGGYNCRHKAFAVRGAV